MRFRVHRGWFILAIVIPIVSWSAWLAWGKFRIENPGPFFLGTVGFAIVLAWLASLTQVVDISTNGLVLNHVNKVIWSDVVAAERKRFLGLAYLKLQLRSGRSWWLPLFFRGQTDMRAALLQLAPDGHAVRACLAPWAADTSHG